jgi:flagellar hook protein FlgE
MMRSMFSGVSGLRSHQVRMDVIGNNIANVNTVGYKGSKVSFSEVFSQTVKGRCSSRRPWRYKPTTNRSRSWSRCD